MCNGIDMTTGDSSQSISAKAELLQATIISVNDLLAEPALGFYLVAESAGEVVASAMVTTEWSDWRNGTR